MAAQSEGNRARFFAQLGKNRLDLNGNTETSKDGTIAVISGDLKVALAESTDSTLGAVPISKLLPKAINAHVNTDVVTDGIISQRTCTVETETVFKAKRERHGTSAKLNISGLIKHKPSGSSGDFRDCLSDTARIEELAEDISTQPTTSIASVESTSTRQIPPSNQLTSFKAPSSFLLRQASINNSNLSRHQGQDPEHIDRLGESHRSVKETNFDISLREASFAPNKRRDRTRESLAGTDSTPEQQSLQILNGELDLTSPPLKESSLKVYRAGPNLKKMSRHNYTEVFDELSDFDDVNESGYNVELPYPLPPGIHKRTNEEFSLEGRSEKRIRIKKYAVPCSFPDSSHQKLQKDASIADNSEEKLGKTFLENEINSYIDRHLDQYEAAKRKWTECSREEWDRGATELIEKVTSVMDFVKDHVRRQVTIYADLHTQIDDYRKSREITSEVLRNAKKNLEEETGMLVESER